MFCVISKETFGEYAVHDIQTNSCWSSNPYGDDYAIVPLEMVDELLDTCGFCDIELNEDGTKLVSFTAKEKPEIEEIDIISPEEQLRADVDYLAIMMGVEL